MKFRVLNEGNKNQKLNLDRNTLFDLYVNKQMTSKEVANHFGCSSKTVRNYLQKYNIPIRQMPDAVKLERSKWSKDKELERSRNVHMAWAGKSKEELKAIDDKKKLSGKINSPEAILKAHETRLKNGTTRISKSENDFYRKLLMLGFNEDDIKRNYFGDGRYPFNCDFYIPSKDLFIEYQGHQTHGPAPFDKENREHLDYLDACNKKGFDMSTWTNRDQRKFETALRNKINLVLLYPKHNVYFLHNGNVTTIDINDINKI